MSAIKHHRSHTHVSRGDAGMDTPSKEYKIGNAKVIVYSPLTIMSSAEKKAWFQSEMEKGNPILKEIEAAVLDCYRD